MATFKDESCDKAESTAVVSITRDAFRVKKLAEYPGTEEYVDMCRYYYSLVGPLVSVYTCCIWLMRKSSLEGGTNMNLTAASGSSGDQDRLQRLCATRSYFLYYYLMNDGEAIA